MGRPGGAVPAAIEGVAGAVCGVKTRGGVPDRFWLTAEGRIDEGLEFNPAPQPPAWFTGMSAAQRAAWESLEAAALSGADLRKCSNVSRGSRRRSLGRTLERTPRSSASAYGCRRYRRPMR